MEKIFKFRMVRDFGTVLNHAFEFIKHEYKRIGQALLYFVLPVFILTGIAMAYTTKVYTADLLNSTDFTTVNSPFNNLKITGINYLLMLVNQSVLCTVIYLFIKLYQEKRGDFKIEELKPLILKYVPKVFLASIITVIITVIAMMFLLIPGIYLGVVFSLVFPLLIIEDLSIGQAMSRSFDLIKKRWWVTFGILVISVIVFYVFSLIFALPMMLITGFKAFNAISTNNLGELYSTSYLIANTVITIIQTCLYLIPFICIGLQYFSLVEEKERPTLQEKIDQMTLAND
ncbi:hypothetical protein [Mangrovibacterium diazotrophicum]|uniref:DUF7847 domain-containing protein n=1 Tax=Mangrovibacterium diazotrophicum TaxID=1261403 RepID=A0A419VXF4_9BACT|nr:hypothetical protein [Mangrovibacterium diazotrophicum]RKD87911.1 hypothetical protein BC643_3919 [Mangrovibacterium diazotrophicum]